jgi:hypothetical protein
MGYSPFFAFRNSRRRMAVIVEGDYTASEPKMGARRSEYPPSGGRIFVMMNPAG